MNLRFGITGHRQKKWDHPNIERERLFTALDSCTVVCYQEGLLEENLTLEHGGATGADLWFGEFAVQYGLALKLFLPFKRPIQIVKAEMDTQQRKSLNDQCFYANEVVVVNKEFSTEGYRRRNIALVDDIDVLFTWYKYPKSGSGHAVKYAKSIGRPVIHLREGFSERFFSEELRDAISEIYKGR